MYTSEATVKLPDTDAAGILFYGNYFRLAHDVYESFLDEIGFGLNYVLKEAEVLLLIVHAECDYKSSLRLGEKYRVELNVEKIGRTSFVLNYTFCDAPGETKAMVRTAHVAVSKETNKPVGLPESLRAKLESHLQ